MWTDSSHVTKVHIPAHLVGLVSLAFVAFHFSWVSVASFLFFNLWISGLGMSVGFHRYFTHKSFETSKFWWWAMLIGGSLAGQGSPIFWVALHRQHHPSSDTAKDIHSPHEKGLWHAYMGWIFQFDTSQVELSRAIDLIRDPRCKFVHRNYENLMHIYWLFLIALVLYVPATANFVAGALIAGMWAIHQEALINSVCHDPRFGIAQYPTKDHSRDVRWLQYVTWGQSLHNSHHAFPSTANFGTHFRPDLGYRLIRLIRKTHHE